MAMMITTSTITMVPQLELLVLVSPDGPGLTLTGVFLLGTLSHGRKTILPPFYPPSGFLKPAPSGAYRALTGVKSYAPPCWM